MKEGKIGLLLSFEPIRAPHFVKSHHECDERYITRGVKLCGGFPEMERSAEEKTSAQQKSIDILFNPATLILLSSKSCWFFAREEKGAETHQTPPASNPEYFGLAQQTGCRIPS